MPRYCCLLEYDGSFFRGFQAQEGLETVQTAVEEAIYRFSQHRATLSAAGRTDKGVHAMGQVIHFDLPRPYPAYVVQKALNFYLKETAVRVIGAEQVSDVFHARFDAVERHYRYVILNRSSSSLWANRAWILHRPICEGKMQEAACELIGHYDFSSFRSSSCQAKSPIKTLLKAQVQRKEDLLFCSFEAPSFLHHQVRIMMVALVKVGLSDWSLPHFKEVFHAKKRQGIPFMAPPQGLFLTQVVYPKKIAPFPQGSFAFLEL
jgi:tRNA pseudouridine38-40 synthase